jgi:bacterioferritin-associated ferredoxin
MKNPISPLPAVRARSTDRSGFENDFQSSNRATSAMIVCLCKAVSCRTIRCELRRGNRTVKGIAQACQAGTGCGACVQQIRELIAQSGAPGHAHDDGRAQR